MPKKTYPAVTLCVLFLLASLILPPEPAYAGKTFAVSRRRHHDIPQRRSWHGHPSQRRPFFGLWVYPLPPRFIAITTGRMKYFYYEGTYYIPASNGYQVVPSPFAPVSFPVNQAESFTINIPNARGGYTGVTLKRSDNGFIGPQGEFYPEFPGVEQLEIIYGSS